MTNPFSPWRHPGRLALLGGYSLSGVVISAITFSIVVTLLATSAGLLATFLFALPVAWLLFVVARALATVERGRVFALTGTDIADPVPPLRSHGWLRRLWERVKCAPRWKEILHHLLQLPVCCVAAVLVSAAWCGSLAMTLLPLYVSALPGESAKFWALEISSGPDALAAAGVGLVGLALVAPWVTVGLARAQVAMARALLGPTAAQAHAVVVAQLQTRRTAAVDSAEQERRRIERDLHDGAQQRLVALAANLGSAREKLQSDPEGGREMVAGAHEEAKAALKEIRDLVRGIHPVILEDRGLDAALSAVVARSPIPVTLDVHVAQRPPAAVESTAYFVVSEALTNVARHAAATRAHVAIARAGDRLVVEVRDDGVGGADPERGSGLRGLRDRVVGLGGSMYVISPAGGPTTISVELPCAS